MKKDTSTTENQTDRIQSAESQEDKIQSAENQTDRIQITENQTDRIQSAENQADRIQNTENQNSKKSASEKQKDASASSGLPEIKISVRQLVEFILTSGDIDNRHGKRDADALQEGVRLHKALQKKEKGDYRAEVPLSVSVPMNCCGESFILTVEGRADGIYTEKKREGKGCISSVLTAPGEYTEKEFIRETKSVIIPESPNLTIIDEIKCTLADSRNLEVPYDIHLSQAKVYAYIQNHNSGYYKKGNTEARLSESAPSESRLTESVLPGSELPGSELTETGVSERMLTESVLPGNEFPETGIRITYCTIETEAVNRIYSYYSAKELSDWFNRLILEYGKWAARDIKWKRIRNASIKKAEFPFSYRDGQRDLVVSVYKCISMGKPLFIEAPTGVGKTMSTVFPSVKAMGEGKAEKIFYLTAKTITRTVAEEAFDLLLSKGSQLKVVTLTAKEKVCVLGKPECNPEVCERAKGHFDRVNNAVFDMLENGGRISREEILKYAEKHCVCPFEMTLDLTTWADAVICDYNYVYDPTVSLKRFFADEKKHDYIFLNDEAHNLVDRGREMYSAEIIKEDVLEVKRIISGKNKALAANSKAALLANRLEAVNKHLLGLKRECEEFEIYESIEELSYRLMRLAAAFDEYLEDDVTVEDKDKVLDFYFSMRNFLSIYEDIGDDYTIYTDYTEHGDFRLKLMCMNPSRLLKRRLDLGRSAIFFSATLLPVNYYKCQLGGTKEDYAVYASSPFDESNRLLMIGRDVSTRYTRRGEAEYTKIARYIKTFTKAKTGNYMVFFPSYKMLEEVGELYLREDPDSFRISFTTEAKGSSEAECHEPSVPGAEGSESAVLKTADRYTAAHEYKTHYSSAPEGFTTEVVFQASRMSEPEKEAFLEAFIYTPGKTRIAFCVMGGIFSEGIDLKSDRLIGAVIVGTGLPMVCNEKELFRGYYDRNSENGFEFAYLYPGMCKVEQSAGRVIRTVSDRGAVLLLDDRFVTKQYLQLFPREWSNYRVVSGPNEMQPLLSQFWSSSPNLEG